MNLIKMKALRAFEEMEGAFKEAEEFLVNEERAFVLTRLGHAERSPAEPISDAAQSTSTETAEAAPPVAPATAEDLHEAP